MLKIRLRRMGSRHRPFYRIVVSDSRRTPAATAREELGFYDPRQKTEMLSLDLERLDYWLSVGAQASPTVQRLADQVRSGATSAPADAEAVAKTAKPQKAKAEKAKTEKAKTEEAKADEPPAEEAKTDEPSAEAEAAKTEEPKVEKAKAGEPEVERAKADEPPAEAEAAKTDEPAAEAEAEAAKTDEAAPAEDSAKDA